MASNTIFKPLRVSEFTSDVLNYAAKGITAYIPTNTTQNIDLAITDDMMLTGMQVVTDKGSYGDYANLQVIDPSNMFGMGVNAVLNQFVTNWYLPPSANMQFDVAYPAKVYAGLIIRVIYTSTNAGLLQPDVFVAVNYKLHKILK